MRASILAGLKKATVYLVGLMLTTAGALAQTTVRQSGSITPGHAVKWISTGVIGDAGTATNGGLSSLGVTNNSGAAICVNSAPTTGPYNQLCFAATTNGGSKISSYALGGATTPGITFDINGTTQGFPVVVGAVAANDLACFFDATGALKTCSGLPSALFANPTGVVGLTAVNGVATTAMRSDAAPPLSQAIIPTWTGVHTFTGGTTGAVLINPTAASLNKGLVITQTSPTTGTVVGPLIFNSISVNNQSKTTVGSDPPLDSASARALQVQLVTGGSNVTGIQEAMVVRLDHTIGTSNSAADKISLVSLAYSTQNSNLTGIYALNPAVWLAPGASHSHAVGMEIENIAQTGSSVQNKIGLRLNTQGEIQGSVVDSAITIVSAGTSPWKNFVNFGEIFNAQSIDVAGSLFLATQAMTIANGFNLPNVTFTGDVINVPNTTLSGAGAFATTMSTSVAQPITATSTSPDANVGPIVKLDRNSASPAASDIIGSLTFSGRNTIAVATDYAAMSVLLNSATSGVEDATIRWFTFVAGSQAQRMQVNAGLSIGTTNQAVSGGVLATGSITGASFIPSGSTVPSNGMFLSAANTVSFATNGVSRGGFTNTTFSLAGSAVLTFEGATSGTFQLKIPAITSGSITLPAGTTDFTATGGAGQVVKQTSAGGAFTVAAAAVSELSGFGTGVATALGVNIGTAGSFVVNGGALGSPSSAGTLPAHSWGGTISGGGNQLNNVIIGTTSPLAGTFTTLVAASKIDLQNNTTFGSATNLANTIGITGADGGIPSYTTNSYANYTQIVASRANGTQASKTAVTTDDIIMLFGAIGYDGTAYSTGQASVQLLAGSLWTGSNHHTYMDLKTTPASSTTQTTALRVFGSGGLGIGTTTDPGLGGLQVNGQQFAPNMASDTATADSTVCTATTGGKFLKGTGALGICLGTSGRQFKTAFAPMRAGLDEIMQIPFLNYRYREGHGDGGSRVQYGPTAQDVEAVLPGLAGHDASGETINYDSGALFFIGLRAIQQLKADNDNLRAEIETIKRRIAR